MVGEIPIYKQIYIFIRRILPDTPTANTIWSYFKHSRRKYISNNVRKASGTSIACQYNMHLDLLKVNPSNRK